MTGKRFPNPIFSRNHNLLSGKIMSSTKDALFHLLRAGLLMMLFFNSAGAESERGEPVDIQGDKIEYSEIKKEIKVTGNVLVRYQEMKITADEATAYPETKDIYAQGNVTLYSKDGVFRADNIHYNFETGKGIAVDGDYQIDRIFGEAEELEKVSEKELHAIRGYLTTCDLDVPHYRIEAKRIKIFLGNKIVARNVFFYVGDVPIMYSPYYSHSLVDSNTGLQITPGYSSEWGFFVLSSLRYYFSHESQGWLHFDWREYKGTGQGLDYLYDTRKYGEGLFKVYYTHERDTKDVEKIGDLPVKEEKYRVKLDHNWNIDNQTRAILKLNKYHDRDFIKDYFYEEYEEEPSPDSYLSLTRREEHYSVSMLARKRLNDHQTITETLPELKLNVNSYKLGDSRFYYTSEYRFNNFNRKIADTGESNHVTRFHADNRLTYPTRLIGPLNWIEFSPYTGRIETFYSRNEQGTEHDFFRNFWYAGYGLTTRIHKLFNIKGRYLGTEVNNLRHLITPGISYTYERNPNRGAESLFGFDGIDAYDGAKYYTLSLENKLQTKWQIPGKETLEEVNLVSLRNSVNYYPQTDDDQFSNITSSLMVKPKRWLNLGLDTSYNPHRGNFEIVNTRAETARDRWSLALSSRYTKETDDQDAFHEGILEASYEISPKWTINAFERFDFNEGELAEYQYRLTRDLHCWTADLSYHYEKERGSTIWLIFRTKAFPEIPVGFAKR
jgi:LPS-assembly protein